MMRLLVILILLLLFGCAQTSEPTEEERTKLEWYINYSWFKNQWGNDIVSQTISDTIDVDIEFVTPIGEENNKLSTILQTNDLPDIITLGWDDVYVSELIKNDRVYALTWASEAS